MRVPPEGHAFVRPGPRAATRQANLGIKLKLLEQGAQKRSNEAWRAPVTMVGL